MDWLTAQRNAKTLRAATAYTLCFLALFVHPGAPLRTRLLSAALAALASWFVVRGWRERLRLRNETETTRRATLREISREWRRSGRPIWRAPMTIALCVALGYMTLDVKGAAAALGFGALYGVATYCIACYPIDFRVSLSDSFPHRVSESGFRKRLGTPSLYVIQPRWVGKDRCYKIFITDVALCLAYLGSRPKFESLEIGKRYARLNPLGEDFLLADPRNFHIPREDIETVRFDPQKKIWLAGIPHWGTLTIVLKSGKRSRFIVLGDERNEAPSSVAQLLDGCGATSFSVMQNNTK